ncbi:hypothetical protein V5O48_015202 [Marasmius crinis-equi]|uniref:Carbonic anhydrase n=1 Tax=Marasmius crinis-equi TaxID=585013 RepID=A0ABR3EV54_9AGAR
MLFTTFLLAASSLARVHASCLHGTSLLRREVKDGQVKVASYGYDDHTGHPLLWGFLNANNTACGTGQRQSPINLNDSIPEPPPVEVSIPYTKEAVFENLGQTLEVMNVTGTTTFNDTKYNLKQFHFHTPSEHRINGEYHPLEMHMVHQTEDGSGFVVLAIFFAFSEDGSTTELLTSATQNIAHVTDAGAITTTGALNFTAITSAFECESKSHYVGSLTTPPCTEDINFIILKEPFPIDVKTYNAMKKIMKFNARYTQNALGDENLIKLAYEKFAALQAQ